MTMCPLGAPHSPANRLATELAEYKHYRWPRAPIPADAALAAAFQYSFESITVSTRIVIDASAGSDEAY